MSNDPALRPADLAAFRAWQAARLICYPPLIDAVWQELLTARMHAPNDDARIRQSRKASDIMDAFTRLTWQQRQALMIEAKMMATTGFVQAVRDAADAVWDGNRVLAAYRAERMERDRQRGEANMKAAEIAAAEAERNAPAILLAGLRHRGIAPSVDGSAIVVPAGTALTAEDHDAIVRHKAGVMALLKAEAKANRPVAVA